MFERLSGIVIFVKAADAGSFSRAAEQLGLTRSAVGKAIARLEERAAIRLFNRTTRSLSLTDEGQVFYERCRRIVVELDALEVSLDADGESPAGSIRISAPVLLGRLCVAPVLTWLLRRHPLLEVDLRLADHLVDLVEERIDLAVRIGPLPDRAGLIATRLGAFDMTVCAAPGYLSARGAPLGLRDLAKHECVPYARRGGRIEPWRISTPNGDPVDVNVGGRMRLDDLETVAQVAAEGGGIACLPTWLVGSRLKAGELVKVLDDHRAHGNPVFAVWQQGPISSRVRVAIDALKRILPARLGDVHD